MNTPAAHPPKKVHTTTLVPRNQYLLPELGLTILLDSEKRKPLKFARHCGFGERLEQLIVSEESQRIADNYVVGQASAKQVAERIRARYGITVK